jgi:hypothetical protein
MLAVVAAELLVVEPQELEARAVVATQRPAELQIMQLAARQTLAVVVAVRQALGQPEALVVMAAPASSSSR